MRRPVALRLLALGTTAAAAAIGVALVVPQASAATGGVTGYATQNGGTTGGAGGQTVRATTGTAIHAALCGRASSSTPIIIQVEGTITVGNTSKVSGSCNTADGVIELKQISNVTLVGVGGGAVFDQIGIHIREASNIIIQNVTVQNVKKSGSPTSNGGDAIGMESNVHNVWIDHNSLLASGGEAEGFDSLVDMKANTNYVTVSYNTLRNSGRGGLIGSSDSDLANGPVTFHHNLYENIDSRTPLLRGATAHIYNNYYTSLNLSGINPRAGGKAKVENNYFRNSKDVLGTFYTDLMGFWQVSGNIFDNVTWSTPGTENHPAGPNPVSNTSISIPYSYSPDPANCTPAIVSQTAGANKGMQVSSGSCAQPTTPTSPTATPTTSPTVRPSTSPTSSPTTGPTQPSGTNLSIGAGADGSSKASGTSYGNVIDGNLSTFWSPTGSTGSISVKWGTARTVSAIVIREASGSAGAIGSWQVINADTNAVLKSGSGAGVITFSATSLKKITFKINSSNATPKVAEFETYA
jgi:pectate lyase